TKMSGTGNDFIIIDHRDPFLTPEEQPAFAKKVCKRMFSVGADGLILIENSADADFQWQFYNADGSKAEMCGNGARCAARYAHEKSIAPASMSFMTQAGLIRAEVKGDLVKLEMTLPQNTKLNAEFVFGGESRISHFSNTGVPHVVYFVEDNKTTPVKQWGHEVRFHARYQPAGTNVNFAECTGKSSLLVRTYERGVEDETMACGTGAVACGLLGGLLGLVESPVAVTSSGGEVLTIYFTIDDGAEKAISGVFLEGPAHFIYEGLLDQEALR
nr:diaminopimelate epimerase [Desulfobulbaceae bacterium]